MTKAHHRCNRPGCERLLTRQQIACHEHWMELPPRLRSHWKNAKSVAAFRAALEEAIAEWGNAA